MAGDFFVNLVTGDLPKARAFYEGLGFTLNPGFTNDDAASFTVAPGRNIHLLTRRFMAQFTDRPISDVSSVWGTLAISADSKEEVDARAEKAIALGGAQEKPPQDHGFMYGRTLRDLDGHIIEFFWMDPKAAPSGDAAPGAQG